MRVRYPYAAPAMGHLVPRRVAYAVCVITCALLPSCRASAPPVRSAALRPWTAGRAFEHVLVIVLENEDYPVASRDPYLRSLAARGVSLTSFDGVAHPSYPNYLAMIGGTTFGVHGDFQRNIDGTMIADRLESAHLTWTQYAQDFPGRCFTGSGAGALYRRKHVPFISFTSVQRNPARCANVVSAARFDAHALPNYAFYSPNMVNDGHDSSLNTAVAWLRGFLDPILADTTVMRTTLVEVTFDESEMYAHGNNHIYTVLLGGMIRPGTTVATPLNHYNVLRTVEANFGLQPMANEAGVSPIVGIWRTEPDTSASH